ncbi:unnamed protein product [Rotaria sp. Silwood2]|nr:unnamed protein product [Rotaria sp. Silwood2]
MVDSNTTTQNIPMTTKTISKVTKAAQTILNEHYVRRIAINQSFVLGSIYDARNDHIVSKLSLTVTQKVKKAIKTPATCNIMKGDEIDIDNLLRNIGIHEELWLSFMLKIVPADGIISLVNYSFSRNRNIRYLYYNCTSQEESIPNQQSLVMINTPKEISDIAATHIVTTIKSGIQALVVLELIDVEKTNLDKLLEEISKKLIENKFDLNKDEENLFNQIILKKIFSNIPNLIQIKTLADFCQTLIKLKPQLDRHLKLEYTLTAIKCFYPNYPKEKATFIPLELKTIKNIKQHLNQLLTKSQQLIMIPVSDIEKPSNENVNQGFDQVQQQIKEIKEIYPDEIKRLCDLISRIHNGTLQQNKINELLTDARKQILQESIMSSNETKEPINHDSGQEGKDNLNSDELPTNNIDDPTINLQKLMRKDGQKVNPCLKKDTTNINSIECNHLEENKISNTSECNHIDISKCPMNLLGEKMLSSKPSDHAEDMSESSKLITSLTPEVVSSLNEPSETISQSSNPQTKNDTYLIEEQYSDIQLESPQRTEEQFKDSVYQLNSSSSKQTNNTEQNNNISKPSIVQIPRDTSQAKELSTSIEKTFSSSNSHQSSTIEVIVPLNNPTNNAAKQSKSSTLPALPTSAVDPRKEKKFINIEQSPNDLKLPKLSTKGSTSSSNESPNHGETRIHSSTSSNLKDTYAMKQDCSDSAYSMTNNYTNVLLLGESGVGKSTFINALVNYIKFETFEKARSSEPVMAMPVSFMMTVGHHFQETIVRFGDEDSNEDHYHPGQSVTQHCRSYVFPIDTRTKIRFIDTPGMGDTRGLHQDDLNIQHILSFINNLSHLNAICILLKPNESRLNIVLRSYFHRLLNFLGEKARHNIIFCFTNTRATFFAPGNTGPLLKNMISSSAIKGIPFEKSNTFCFDSESFRYLIALRNGIEFDKYQENEYQRSWTSSVTESNRLLQYFYGAILKPFPQNEWRSVEHAQFRISHMIRPMQKRFALPFPDMNRFLSTSQKSHRHHHHTNTKSGTELETKKYDFQAYLCSILKDSEEMSNFISIFVEEHGQTPAFNLFESCEKVAKRDDKSALRLNELSQVCSSRVDKQWKSSIERPITIDFMNQMLAARKVKSNPYSTEINPYLV